MAKIKRKLVVFSTATDLLILKINSLQTVIFALLENKNQSKYSSFMCSHMAF
jgi:hypothetical protein